MNRRQFLAATGVASVTTLAGCGGGGGGTPTVAAESVDATVTISDDLSFDPPIVEVETGAAVEWVNEAGESRSVVSNDELGNSAEWGLDEDVETGQTFRYTFDESGVYSYHEDQETWFRMCGAVAVGDSTADDVSGLPCE